MNLAESQSGRGHGRFCNLLIIRYHNNEGVETWPKNACVSTPCFITHLKSASPKIERGRVPPETLTGVVPMMHYSHSDALNVSLGALGTFTKYLNPVIFSNSDTDIMSCA